MLAQKLRSPGDFAGLLVSALLLTVGPAAATPLPAGRLIVPPGQTPIAALRRAQELRINPPRRAAGNDVPSALPKLIAGSVSSRPVQAAAPLSLPSLNFSFTAPSGLSFVEFDFTSPNRVQAFSTSYAAANLPRNGRIAFSALTGLPLYAASGAWPLSTALLVDGAGNVTEYTARQLARLMSGSAINVVNHGTIDDRPPSLLAGQVLTPVVRASGSNPYFSAQVTAADSGSGYYVAYVFVQAPGANFSFADFTPLANPVAQGTARNVTSLAGAPAGTWTIAGYMICDAVENCISSNSLTDVRNLFGTTTFIVTE